jgi:hypothetical protein
MKTQKPLTLDQTLDALHQAAEDSDFLDEVLSMSKEEVDKDLQKAGIDLKALDARMATREAEIRLAQDGPAPEVSKSRTAAPVSGFSKKLAALFVAIGTFLGGIGTYAVELWTASTTVAPVIGPAIAFSAAPTAEELRTKGFEACGRGHWQECLDDLDLAKAQNPDGDAQPEVQNARTLAQRQLHR